MKKNLVYLLLASALFTSCSSVYRSSQTPDDVYYSPAKKIITEDQYEAYNSSRDNYNSSDDEYLRMKVQDHERWSAIDDYDYWYDSRYYANNYYSPYTSSISLGVGFGSYPYYNYTSYNPYWYNPWHSCYSPYYTVVYYKNPTVYYQANRYNVAGYNNRNYNNYNLPLQNGNRSNAYNNSNTNANRTRNNNYYQNQNNDSRSTRTFNNSSSNSGSGGGSRISGGGTRTRP